MTDGDVPRGLLLVASYLRTPDRSEASSPAPGPRNRGWGRGVVTRSLGSARRCSADPAHPSSVAAQGRAPSPALAGEGHVQVKGPPRRGGAAFARARLLPRSPQEGEAGRCAAAGPSL